MVIEPLPDSSTHVVVLGDSLSIVGYGIKRMEDTWPYLLRSEFGHGVRVSVHTQGRLTCGVESVGKTYYDQTPMGWLATALSCPASVYLIMLGTNDIQSAGSTFDGIVQGYSRIVLLLLSLIHI